MRVAMLSAIIGVALATTAHSAQVKWVPLNKPPAAKPNPTPPPVPPAPVPPPLVVAAPVEPVAQATRDQSQTAQRIAAIETAVKATLKDPDSARFNWPFGFAFGQYKPVWGRRPPPGWVTCGTINAKNGYGGYTGQYAVVGVVDNGGSVIKVDMDQPDRWSAHAGWVADQCRKLGMEVI